MFIPCVSDNYYRSIHTPFVASPPLPNKPYLFHIEGGGYLGSFIGEKEAETEWLVLEIEDWIEAVQAFGKQLEQVAEMEKFVPHSA